MRRFWIEITVCIALAIAASSPWAQSYPSKPVRVIVTFPPGGTPDIYGRIMSTELSKLWGQSVVVENRTGAGGTIGTEYVTKSAPDGYTLLFAADAPITVVPALVSKLPYDTLRDLAPIVNVSQGPFVLLVNAATPVNNLRELIAYIRARPGKISYASSGNGSQQHLSMEMIRTMAGLDMVHIPYKGFGAGLTDVLGGQVLMIFGGATASIQLAKSGKVKALGVTGKTRIKALPDAPSIAEELAGYDILAWYGFFGPAGLPREIVNKIHADVVTIVRRPDFQERVAADGMEPVANTPEQFATQIKADMAVWARVVKASGATLD